MKKIFTLIAMATLAMSANAQTHEPGLYPAKNIVWNPITWKNGNNKKDKDNNDMFFLMGTGNGYATLLAEYYYSEDKGDYFTRPAYTYIGYEEGETGVPAYGLYYKFTPSASGTLKITVWVNKGNRKTFVVKGSTGVPMAPYVDYTMDGYVNGQNTNSDQPKIDEATGQQALDNEGNPIWIQHPTYFTADEIKARNEEQGANLYVIDKGNQAFWGYITFNVEAGESYIVYQQSSQLGFGGFEFNGQSYVATPGGKLASEFAAVVDGEGNAINVDDRGSVVTFTAAGVAVEAVGGAVPLSLEADFDGSGISNVKADANTNAQLFNLAGQKVGNDYKGVVIQNGRKMVVK